MNQSIEPNLIHALSVDGVDLAQLSGDVGGDLRLHNLARLVPHLLDVGKRSPALVQDDERLVQVLLQEVVTESRRQGRHWNLLVGPLGLQLWLVAEDRVVETSQLENLQKYKNTV